jgi:hydroxymethylbilane synthase
MVAREIERLHPGLKVPIVPIRTSGDDASHKPSGPMGIKGLFVKEIEEAILEKKVDLAIHSAKDLPARLPDGLVLGPVPERASPMDALVGGTYRSILDLPKGARIGTSSLRRRAQLLCLRRDFQIKGIRGNVDTRVGKVSSGEVDAVILAAAGLVRLKGAAFPFQPIPYTEILPAPGQGALALELREGDGRVTAIISPLDHFNSRVCLLAERAFMERLGAGCQTPAAAWARVEGNSLLMDALVCSLDGTEAIKGDQRLVGVDPLAGQALGEGLARDLLSRGAGRIIADAESEIQREWGE